MKSVKMAIDRKRIKIDGNGKSLEEKCLVSRRFPKLSDECCSPLFPLQLGGDFKGFEAERLIKMKDKRN